MKADLWRCLYGHTINKRADCGHHDLAKRYIFQRISLWPGLFSAKCKNKKIVQFFGAAVPILFGLDILLGVFGMSDQPVEDLFQWGDGGVFLKAAVMTASNPLTIIFWGGVLSATATSENICAKQLLPFGLGCTCATFVFLHGVGFAGTFLPLTFLRALNGCVDAVIISFGLRMLRAYRTQADF